MEYTVHDDGIVNPADEDKVADSKLIEVDEPVTVSFGQLNNGTEVTADCQWFAAVDINRSATDEEKAMGVEGDIDFSTVLIAGSDGEAEREQITSVRDGGVEQAIAAFEEVVESRDDGLYVNQIESGQRVFTATENGDITERTVQADGPMDSDEVDEDDER